MNLTQENFSINPGSLTLNNLRKIVESTNLKITLNNSAKKAIQLSVNTVNGVISKNETVYGINTGFGRLAHTKIENKELSDLQHNLILSHATGVGELLSDDIVRLITIIKINSLGRGHSGVRFEVLELLLKLINNGYYPCIPSKGSVGASGDLAPLAHLSAPLIGHGFVRHNNEVIPAKEALSRLNEKPLILGPLEGLSLLNGTQVSTALAIKAFFDTEQIFAAAISTGALTTDALLGSKVPFRKEIHDLRGHKGQKLVASTIYMLLKESEIEASHENCDKVQDAYSLRCQPQVMGACLDNLLHVANILEIEANAVTNNPIVLPKTDEAISGGNFHAEPVAFAADILAMILTEISSISERRIATLVDSNYSSLPAFLVENGGVNSGFMIAQVTAAALVSENKSCSFPCSVDSIPTSANQEDHVSMATHAARRLLNMIENTSYVIAVELLAACQGIDFRRPLKSSKHLEKLYSEVRSKVPNYDKDRYFAKDIEMAQSIVLKSELVETKRNIELPSFS